jgi:ubiquinone/menaquinone biosynthesis C-methylase UbiE
MGAVTDVVAEGYDAVYASWDAPRFHALWARTAVGGDAAEGYEHLNFAGVQQLRRLAAELRPCSAGRLLDVACGAGGPGFWIARENHSLLLGVDLSTVGTRLAARRATELGIEASYVVASATQLALADGAISCAMSLDSLQYIPDKRTLASEIHRVLAPGGRFAFTAFEVEPARVVGLPVLGVDPVADYATVLQDAGFVVETYEQTVAWREHLEGAYSAVIAAQDELREQMSDAALASMVLEMSLTLEVDPYCGRPFVVAVKR